MSINSPSNHVLTSNPIHPILSIKRSNGKIANVELQDTLLKSEVTNSIKRIANQIYDDLGQECSVEQLEFDKTPKGEIQITVKINNINYSLKKFSLKVNKMANQLMEFIEESGILFSNASKETAPSLSFCLQSPPIASEPVHKLKWFLDRLFTFESSVLLVSTVYIKQAIAKENPEELNNLYINQQFLFREIKKEIFENNPHIGEIFSSTEIDILLNKLLIEIINSNFKKLKKPPWDEKKLYELNILKILNDFKNNEFSNKFYQKLLKVNPIDIPVEILSNIPLTIKNKVHMISLWTHIIGNLFVKGGLNELNEKSNLVGIIVQANYINHYLNALEIIPPEIKNILEPFLDKLEEEQPSETLINFLIQNFPDQPIANPKFSSEQKIYKDKIHDTTKKLQTELIDYTDGIGVINMLSLEDRDYLELLESFADQIHSNFTEEEKKSFPIDRIMTLFFDIGEKTAVSDFKFTTSQLHCLREYREVAVTEHYLSDVLKEHIKETRDLDPNDEDYQDKRKSVKTTFMEDYEPFQQHITIEIITKIKDIDLILPEVILLLWKNGLNNLCNSKWIAKVNSLNYENLVKFLKPYIQAKTFVENPSLPEEIKESLKNLFLEIEKKITNEDFFNYLESSPPLESTNNLSELLLSDEILEEVEHSSTRSVLSPFQKMELMHLSRYWNRAEKVHLTLGEKKELNKILIKLSKDRHLVKILTLMINKKREIDIVSLLEEISPFLSGIAEKIVTPPLEIKEKIPAGILIEHLKDFLILAEKLQNLEKTNKELQSILVKAEELLKKHNQNPFLITKDDKLTLTEIGKLSHCARLNRNTSALEGDHSFTGIVKKLELDDVNPSLRKLVDNSQHSREILDQIDKIFKPELDTLYKDGDLLAYVGKKKGLWAGKPISVEERLTTFACSGFTHGGKLFHKEEGVQISHVMGGYIHTPLNLYEICISNIWEIDILPLIPSSFQVLKNVYGNDWKGHIKNMYEKIENQLHLKAPDQFDQVENYQSRRVKAALADHHTLLKIIGFDLPNHEKSSDRNLEEIYKKFFSNEVSGDTEQICSEWASKATLVAMVELNRVIVEDLSKKLGSRFNSTEILSNLEFEEVAIPDNVKEYLNGIRHWKAERSKTKQAEKDTIKFLKNQNYSDEEIALIIRMGNKEIFDVPYSRRERFKTIHPGRMVKLLVDKKCAHKKPPPAALRNLVDLELGQQPS
jgi:hypothetical protein